jgi:hypothetical protein
MPIVSLFVHEFNQMSPVEVTLAETEKCGLVTIRTNNERRGVIVERPDRGFGVDHSKRLDRSRPGFEEHEDETLTHAACTGRMSDTGTSCGLDALGGLK